jgi:hypothetical protein
MRQDATQTIMRRSALHPKKYTLAAVAGRSAVTTLCIIFGTLSVFRKCGEEDTTSFAAACDGGS